MRVCIERMMSNEFSKQHRDKSSDKSSVRFVSSNVNVCFPYCDSKEKYTFNNRISIDRHWHRTYKQLVHEPYSVFVPVER
mgnify:CR=1 FL=1